MLTRKKIKNRPHLQFDSLELLHTRVYSEYILEVSVTYKIQTECRRSRSQTQQSLTTHEIAWHNLELQ
jgi:hypothetical protein